MKLELETSTKMYENETSVVWCDNQTPPRYYVCEKDTPDQWWTSTGELDRAKDSADFTSSFWKEKMADEVRLSEKTARIDGVHYTIARETDDNRAFRGYGGARFVIQFNDGRRVVTTNLWCQGRIPMAYRDVLADNAKFVEGTNSNE